jgi:hypothetical protein
MKKILFLMLATILFILPTQAQGVDTVLAIGKCWAGIMSTSATTVDVQFGSMNNSYSSYSVTAYTAASTSTLTVWTKSWNNSVWKQVGLVDLSDGANVVSITASTTAKEFLILDTQPYKMRVLFSGSASSTTTVLVTGKFGSVISGTAIGGTTVSLTSPTTIGLGTGTNNIGNVTYTAQSSQTVNGTVSLPNDVVSDSGQVIGLATATYTAGVVIAQSTSAASCSLIALPNAPRVSGGSGFIAQILLIGLTATTNNSVTGTIGVAFYQSTAGGTSFGDGANYQPTIAILRGRVGQDSVNVSTWGTNGASVFTGHKFCFIPFKCDAGSVLYMRLFTISAVPLKDMIFYKITYARN